MSRLTDTGGTRELTAMLLAAIALRPQLVGVGPILPRISDDLELSHAVAGLLGTIPVLCMGIFALPAARLAARWGTHRSVTVALGLIAGGGLLRTAAPGAPLVLGATVPIGMGLGLAGALLPIAVKERFVTRAGRATGVYSTGIQIGAVGSSLSVVALATLGGWRIALLVLGAVTVGCLLAWVALDDDGGASHPRAPAGAELRRVFRTPIVWVLIVGFGLMASIYYGAVAWLPDAYVERGWSEGEGAAVVALISVGQIPGAMFIAWIGERTRDRRLLLRGSTTIVALATLLLVLLPEGGYAWASIDGLGMGALFAVLLTLPLDLAEHPTEAAAISGAMLTGGYTCAALSPVLLGALRDATGTYHDALFGLAAAAAGLFALSLVAGRGRALTAATRAT